MTKDNLHLGFLAQSLYPHATGGMEIFNYYLIKELSLRLKITVFTAQEVHFDKKVAVRIVSTKLFGLSGFKMRDFWFVAKVIPQIAFMKDKPNIFHVPFTSNAKYLSAFISRFCKLLKLPYVVSIHGGGLGKWNPRWMYEPLFEYATRIVAVSEVIQAEYVRRTKREIDLILPLIPFNKSGQSRNDNRKLLGLSQESIVIVYVGSIKKIKGTRDIILSLGELGEAYLFSHKVMLIIVGDGPQRPELKELAFKTNVDKFIRFYGQVPYEDVSIYYEAADFYIISSQFEGTSKSLVGAMFQGLPIIGTDVPGINNVITNKINGLLYSFGDYKQLTGCIKTLIESSDMRKLLSINSKQSYNKLYSFDKTVSDFTAIYSLVVSEDKAKK